MQAVAQSDFLDLIFEKSAIIKGDKLNAQ